MVPDGRLVFAFLASATLLGSAAVAGHVSGGQWTFSTNLTAAAEPGGGDTTMNGTFTMRVNPGEKEVCYTFVVNSTATLPADIADDEPTAAHIHIGDVGVAGDIVIPLETPELGVNSEVCSDAHSRDLAKLIAKPEDFYVNVHTDDFGAGAIRGQFARPDH